VCGNVSIKHRIRNCVKYFNASNTRKCIDIMDDTTEHFYVNIQLRGTRKKVLIQALLADFCSEIFKQEKSICTGAKQKTTRRNF